MPKLVGKRVTRNEDARLLTGRAMFVDDVHLDGMLHVAFLRSEHAHAKLKRLDVSAAKTHPGVVSVITAEDLGDYWKPGPLLVPPPPIKGLVFNARTQVPLVKTKARHVGEPVAMVVAESRYIAEDAVAKIVVEWEVLEAVVDLEKALEKKSPVLHEDLGSNIAAHVVQRIGDWEQAKKEAAVVVKRRFWYDRGVAAAIENRC